MVFVVVLLTVTGFSDDALKGLYKFETGSGGVALDSSSSQSHATLVNSPQWTTDGEFKALAFDKGNLTYLDCGADSGLSGLTDFTVSAWVKTTSSSKGNILFQRSPVTEDIPDGTTGSYAFLLTGKGQVTLSVQSNKNKIITSTGKVRDGQWHHVLALRQGEIAKLYIDGVFDSEKDGRDIALNPTLPVIIGAQIIEGGSRYHFDGLLDDITIRSEALSEEEIAFLAANHGESINSDADGDGLTNREELALGLDPLKKDSDNDNLNDGDEIALGTDPKKLDTDEDGVLDGDETSDRTDPLVHNNISIRGWMATPIGDVSEESTINYYDADQSFVFHTASLTDKQSESLAFAYKTITGDFVATAKVNVHGGEKNNSKAAFTVRNNLERVTPYVSAAITNTNGSVVNFRKKGNANIKGIDSEIGKAPYWVRIVRKGSVVDSYISPDGIYWSRLYTATGMMLTNEVKVGLSVNSNSLEKTSNVTFTDVVIEDLTDFDNDGLYDIEELMISSNEALADTDIDDLYDKQEVDEVTSPIVAPTEVDGKIYHKQGLVTRYYPEKLLELKDIERRKVYKAFITDSASLGLGWHKIADIGGRSVAAVRMCAMINIPSDGEYTFYTASDNGSMLYINDKVVVNNDGIHHMRQEQGTVTLSAGLHKFELQYFQRSGKARLWTYWQSSQFAKQPIPDAVFVYSDEDYQQALSEVDSDADGLSDMYEEANGTDPNNKDTDGDGLTDKEEDDYGTDPTKTDSDGDGISDWAEIKEFYTNPLNAEFDGTYTDVVLLYGDAFDSSVGDWDKTISKSAKSQQRRGSLDYKFNLDSADIYRVLVEFSGEGSIDDYATGVAVEVDGLFIAEKGVEFSKENTTSQFYVMPYLQPGEHTLRVAWKNALGGRVASIKRVYIQTINGPDANENGVKDWVEVTREKSTSVTTAPEASYVSPIYLEGKARYVDAMSIDGNSLNSDSNRGVNEEWFAYVDLVRQGANDINLSFQNGLIERTVSTQWTPLNLINNEASQITVRKGTTILLTAALVDAQNTSDIYVTVNDVSYDLEFIPGKAVGQSDTRVIDENITVTGDQMTYKFPEPGVYTISAVYDPRGNGKGKEAIAGQSVTINVVDVAEPSIVPAFLPERRRVWSYTGLPENAIVEVEETVWFEREGEELSITMTDAITPHYATVRLEENGPIFATVKLQPVRFYGVGQTSMLSTPLDDGTSLVEVFFVADPLMDNVTYEVDIYIPGVTFDDGKRGSRILTKGDFNEIGETSVKFIKTPRAVKTATCHHLHVHQNGEYVGREY